MIHALLSPPNRDIPLTWTEFLKHKPMLIKTDQIHMLMQKKILEINPNHPAIKELFDRVKDEPDKETEELARVLFEGSLITSGYSLREPADFSSRFYRLFNSALGIPKDAPI